MLGATVVLVYLASTLYTRYARRSQALLSGLFDHSARSSCGQSKILPLFRSTSSVGFSVSQKNKQLGSCATWLLLNDFIKNLANAEACLRNVDLNSVRLSCRLYIRDTFFDVEIALLLRRVNVTNTMLGPLNVQWDLSDYRDVTASSYPSSSLFDQRSKNPQQIT